MIDLADRRSTQAYRDELGDKFQMHVAFSRQTEKKVYVQDILMGKWEEVTRVIRNNGAVYVCGDVRMGKGVYSTLRDILIKGEGISEDEAEDRLRDMKQSRFYHVRKPPVIFLFAWLRSV